MMALGVDQRVGSGGLGADGGTDPPLIQSIMK